MTDDIALAAAFEAIVGSVQRLAMRIVDTPKDQREVGLETHRCSFLEELKKQGYDNEQASRLVDWQIEAIRFLIAESEVSRGGHGGKAVGTCSSTLGCPAGPSPALRTRWS